MTESAQAGCEGSIYISRPNPLFREEVVRKTAKTRTLLDYQPVVEQQRLAKDSQEATLRKLRNGEVVPVPDIPQFDIPDNSTLFIATQDVAYSSHGVHEFPA